MRYCTCPLSACLALCVSLMLTACGGGAGGSSSNPVAVSLPPSAASIYDSNVTTIDVKSGPSGNVNIPYVTINVCTSGGIVGSSNCKPIDNVLLDTGSTGLRLFATQLSAAPALALPPQTVNGSSPLSECANFLNNNAWGSVKLADVVIAKERALSVPIQLMDANDVGAGNCWDPSQGPPLFITASDQTKANTQILGANGILGLGLFVNDGQSYFDCTQSASPCQTINLASVKQVQNPVSFFAVNNNGVVLQLPSLAPSGAASSAQGYLTFGVGTQPNNRLGSANVLRVNQFGQFNTVYGGNSLPGSILDSGSNGLYFDDAALSAYRCSASATGFYCPPTTRNLSATIQLGGTGGNVNVGFSIANTDQLFAPNGVRSGNYAFNSLGGSFGGSGFDWGLPFFFGRSVYTVIENASVSGVAFRGPWNAFTN